MINDVSMAAWRLDHAAMHEAEMEREMASKTRDDRVIVAVACPRCAAPAGQPCRNPIAHQTARGPQDRRAQPIRPHVERRVAWIDAKRGL